MVKRSIERLESLGYTMKAGDDRLVAFVLEGVESAIKNACNTKDIPQGLENIAIDRVCGEFFFIKQQTGTLTDFEEEMAVQSVRVGDVTVALQPETTQAQRLDSLITHLRNSGREALICFRKIKW